MGGRETVDLYQPTDRNSPVSACASFRHRPASRLSQTASMEDVGGGTAVTQTGGQALMSPCVRQLALRV